MGNPWGKPTGPPLGDPRGFPLLRAGLRLSAETSAAPVIGVLA
jgi:hypothetical protein